MPHPCQKMNNWKCSSPSEHRAHIPTDDGIIQDAEVFFSNLYVDLGEAVVQGGGVTQQQHPSVFPRLFSKGDEEPGDADEAQSLPAACRQGEVSLGDPTESHPGAVRGDAGQRVRPQPQCEVRGRLWVFRWVHLRWQSGGIGGFLLLLLLVFNSAFYVVSVGGLLGAAAAWPFAQQLQVLCSGDTHHGVNLWFAFGKQRQANPHQTHLMRSKKACNSWMIEGRHFTNATWPLTFRWHRPAPTREQLQRLLVPWEHKNKKV